MSGSSARLVCMLLEEDPIQICNVCLFEIQWFGCGCERGDWEYLRKPGALERLI